MDGYRRMVMAGQSKFRIAVRLKIEQGVVKVANEQNASKKTLPAQHQNRQPGTETEMNPQPEILHPTTQAM
ncbi:hypothetical protein [Heyndrickxia coagulans]|uniref:hypothetical protein n=1 Tax=Heyndrickxia coagulans TaxID=1398 RepID=UPI001F287D68|nr:hypothetical protein [Heyndrickxia coagulans]